MQFLKTLFWVVVAIVAVAFSMNNWIVVPVRLWGELQADVKLPVLALGFFLLGWLPLYLYHHFQRWRLKRRIETAERSLGELRPAEPLSTVDPLAPVEPAAP